jgi:hypothetical protein
LFKPVSNTSTQVLSASLPDWISSVFSSSQIFPALKRLINYFLHFYFYKIKSKRIKNWPTIGSKKCSLRLNLTSIELQKWLWTILNKQGFEADGLFQLPVLTNFNGDLGVFFQESYETVFGVHLITNFSLKNNMKMKVKELEKHFVLKMLSHSLIRIIAKSF